MHENNYLNLRKIKKQKGVGKNLTPFLYVLRGTFYICPTTCIPLACLADASFLVLLYNAIDNFVMHTVDRKIYVVIPI